MSRRNGLSGVAIVPVRYANGMPPTHDAPWIQPVTLQNAAVLLVPLERAHAGPLVEAAADGRLWELWYTTVPQPQEMAAEIERRLELQRQGSMLPFTVIDACSGRVVGQTTFMNIDAQNQRLEIGSTWYAAGAQRTAINTASKLLLLTHAFERLQCIAVEFRTSWFNHQSRRAIERLGAKLDGVLRHHMHHRNGTIRDTVVYSIIAPEWPGVRALLTGMIDAFGMSS
jgi:RimJ/RimL family protein N-acetyltransferase